MFFSVARLTLLSIIRQGYYIIILLYYIIILYVISYYYYVVGDTFLGGKIYSLLPDKDIIRAPGEQSN